MTIRQSEFGEKRSPGKGDSGGPLTYLHNGQHTLIGVTSGFFRLTKDNFETTKLSTHTLNRDHPNSTEWSDTFTRVSYFRDWIEQNMKSTKYCQNGLSAET